MKRLSISSILLSSLLFLGTLGVTVVVNSHAATAQSNLAEKQLCEGAGGTYTGGNCVTPGEPQTVESTFQTIADILLFLIGAVAVIMLIIGGLRYVASGGDQSAVNSAKNTIIYAVVGIIVAFLAYAIVRFVTSALL